MSMRFLRVEQVLTLATGLFDSPDEELWRAFATAIDAEVPEADDLDFKREWWSRSEEIAKDCAAVANAGGGVIIIGIDDGGRDVAAGWAAFEKPQSFDERVQQATASSTAPKLPVVRTRWVPNPENDDTGVAIVAVSRSPQAPHAVVYGRERFGYPVRRSSTTDWLSESEVADRYRSRFDMARSDHDRAEEVHDAARPALDRASAVWVTVALVPSLRGNLTLSEDEEQTAERLTNYWQHEMPLQQDFTSNLNSRVRRKRIVLSSDWRRVVSQYQHHELWLDGSGFASAAIAHGINDAARPWSGVNHSDIEFYVLRLTDLLVKHAVRAGASGDIVLTAQLLPAWDGDSLNEVVTTPDYTRTGQPTRIGIPLLINQVPTPSDDEYAHARRIDGEPGQVTAPLLDIADTPRELVLAVRRLLLDTLAEDGVTTGRLLTENGAIDRMGVLSRRLAETRDWAARRGFEFI
ncbi:hypothetical protein ASE01_00885 [Nocardioides sp. Root190]|uniref:RNA-binding domain-containing protein n=1 Tax=Nocardioides sp. Root190 TaxID=1736488 RepID=UPI0006F5F614|nr:RNA-binding domain-containing protein [Nocardioides sp. Root190]KRB80093.1 hypothetical protein ASE01_00885 [Nocardioides sp. Root190]